MGSQQYSFSFDEFDRAEDLDEHDALLLKKARSATSQSYAPYSKFSVAAVALLLNGEMITATNQENASFPLGLCAERVLLATVASIHPGVAIDTIAIAYQTENGKSDHPISPCGICRQALSEFETRMDRPIRLILSGMEGKILIIRSASLLLPLSFKGSDLL